MTTVAFDVDDTLIVPACAVAEYGQYNDQAHQSVCGILFALRSFGCRTVIWSGGGEQYARDRAREFKLEADVICAKTVANARKYEVDLTFDDQQVQLGKVNIKVPRVNNRINRKQAHGGLAMAEFYRKQERKEINERN